MSEQVPELDDSFGEKDLSYRGADTRGRHPLDDFVFLTPEQEDAVSNLRALLDAGKITREQFDLDLDELANHGKK